MAIPDGTPMKLQFAEVFPPLTCAQEIAWILLS
jgi:hypothetical protein